MRRGLSLVEVLIVVAIMSTVALPVLSLISTGSREGALSEDFMFAEVLASRFLEEWGSQSFESLDALVPRTITAKGAAPDALPARPHTETLSCPPGFAAELTLKRVREGLLSLEVTVQWQVPRERVPRKFALYLLKHDPEISLEAGWAL